MIIIPEEHRPASNDRKQAESALAAQGWTVVKLPRTEPTRHNMQFIEMLTWCEVHIGQGRVEVDLGKIDLNDMWYSFSWYGYWNFWFRKETDATAFALRWM